MKERDIENLLLSASLDLEHMTLRESEVEILVKDEDGDVDYEATEALADEVIVVMGWSAYRTGYGAWVVSEGYRVSQHDYNSPSWEGHY